MSNSFWNFTVRLVAGQLAKADDVNDNLDGISAGLDLIETELGKCIQLTNLGSATVDITESAASRANKIVSFDASGNVVAVVNIGSWQGDWSAQAYVVRDIIKDAAGDVGLNNIYMCNTAHTGTDLSTQIANWDLVIDLTDVVASETAAAASAAAASTSETNAASSATTASNWAQLITAFVSGSDNSAKSWAIGGTGDGDPAAGSAKAWGITAEDSLVDGADYSALHWAAKAAASAASINFASGTFTAVSLAAGASEDSGDIPHGLGTDDIDFGFKVVSASISEDFVSAFGMDGGGHRGQDIFYLSGSDFAIALPATPTTENLAFNVKNHHSVTASTIAVEWWARPR